MSYHLDTSPKSEASLQLHSRAVPSVEAHHRVGVLNTGRNSGGSKKKYWGGIANKPFRKIRLYKLIKRPID